MLRLADTKLDVLPLLLDSNLNGLELGQGSRVFSLSLEKKSQIPEMAKEFFARGLQGDSVHPLRQGH